MIDLHFEKKKLLCLVYVGRPTGRALQEVHRRDDEIFDQDCGSRMEGT